MGNADVGTAAGTSLSFSSIVILGCSRTKNESYKIMESAEAGVNAVSVAANDIFFVKRLHHAERVDVDEVMRFIKGSN